MLPKNRPPTPPGEMLLEEYLRPRGITQVDLAARMGVPRRRADAILGGRRRVTAEAAILLSEALNASPELWMGLQASHDLWNALRRRRADRRSRGPRNAGKHQGA